jgi:hypothetical protein
MQPPLIVRAVLLVGPCIIALPAAGMVSQPTGEVMPQPTGAAEIGIATSRGFPPDAVTLAGLFKYRGETIDPVLDALTTPGMFSPQCGFSGELVLRGGGCNLVFGWYNATPGSTTPPPPAQIYPLVPADPRAAPPLGLMCADGDFCPLATMMTTQAPQHSWIPQMFSADNIRADPNYKGGLIGFAIIGDMKTSCAQTKYSQAELNTKQLTTGQPWITALVWQSKLDPNAYYIGFEDLPLTPTTWKGQGGAYSNDGDFNDFVYKITGVSCDGGGKPCATGMPGVCAGGTTQCIAGDSIVCKPDVAAKDEICDGLDNNCDGVVDEGSPCGGANQVCDKGVCVAQCNDGEFPCLAGFVCDQGFCKDPRCLNVTCAAEQVCNHGICVGGCDGVSCPLGQTCRVGRCVNPCEGVTCSGTQVCENGVCLPSCTCRNCSATTTCAASGHCVDDGCETKTCAAGTICAAGVCHDPCDGARCPSDQECKAGTCMDVPRATMIPGGGLKDPGASGGGGVSGRGLGTGGTAFGGADAGIAETAGAPIRTCGCEVSGAPAGWMSALSLGLFAWVSASRRRNRRR